MGRLVLILGGARSGKSAAAERMARRAGDRVAFVATAQALDAEMERRIAAHRASRPAEWRTLEEPLDLASAVETAARDSDLVLVDCLTLWVSNHLCRLPAGDAGRVPQSDMDTLEEELRAQVGRISRAAREGSAELLVVSNEVGMGLVPGNPLGRSYRDLLGVVNRWVAAEADQLLLMVAGVPVDLKKLAAEEWL